MGALVAVGIGSFVLVSLVVGTRLLRLWRRTRQLPELAMGGAFLLNGGIGYLLTVAAGFAGGLEAAVFAVAAGLGAIGCAGLCAFNHRVFRPGRDGAALAWGLVAALALSFVARLATSDFAEFEGAWAWVGLCARTAVFAWAGVEAARYHRMSRRQLALGLTDAATTRRFFWWSAGAFAATAVFAWAIVRLAFGLGQGATEPISAIPTASLGLLAATSIWLAFGGAGTGSGRSATDVRAP